MTDILKSLFKTLKFCNNCAAIFTSHSNMNRDDIMSKILAFTSSVTDNQITFKWQNNRTNTAVLGENV